jgi:hypothetical protein
VLLQRFGLQVTLSTVTLGINSDFAAESFYMEHLEQDERRVGGVVLGRGGFAMEMGSG